VENHDTIMQRLNFSEYQEPSDTVDQFFDSEFVKKYSPELSDIINNNYDTFRKNKFK